MKGHVRVGCSGWQYKHWMGDFYPDGLPVSRWFEHYTQTLDTVEINNIHDMHGSASGTIVVGPFIYARFHYGTHKYGGRYEDRRLHEWADWLAARSFDGLDVFAYFNNDVGGHAPRDAVRLRERILLRLPSPRA